MTNLSERHEREFANLVPGGEQTVASGAKLEKHDVRSNHDKTSRFWRFRYELKSTQKKGYRLTYSDWKELTDYIYGRTADERPAWAIRFYGEDTPRASDTQVLADLVVIDLNDWIELMELLDELMTTKESSER